MENDDQFQSPIPWGLVEHVNRTKTGKTVMAISLPIETRARLAQASIDLGCSKLAIVRAAINQFLAAHEQARRSGQEQAYRAVETAPMATVGASGPTPDPVPRVALEPVQSQPEQAPTPEPSEPEPPIEPEQIIPVPEGLPKKSRAKKGGSL